MIDVRVIEKSALTNTICRIRFCPVGEAALPKASPGAHIDVALPSGVTRQYSLCTEIGMNYYEIAVLKETNSRGGSEYVHASLKVGDTLQISEPKNLFPLETKAKQSLLIAAGVGITPILSMAEHLASQNQQFSLHFCAKNPENMAYRERITGSELAAYTQCYFSQVKNANRIKLAEVILSPQQDAHLYVCGPAAFNDEVVAFAKAAGWEGANIHREYFAAAPIDHSTDGSFEIEINSTGDKYTVGADETILNVLEDQGFFIPVACEEGVCGTCVTGLLKGEADHKDVFMTDAEHAKMDKITPCCSRAKSKCLTLDL